MCSFRMRLAPGVNESLASLTSGGRSKSLVERADFRFGMTGGFVVVFFGAFDV